MSFFIPILAVVLAILAVAIATLHLAMSLHRLEARLPDVEAPPPSTPDSGRPSRPFGAALYAEPRPSPLAGLASLPGAAWLGVASILLIVAVASGMRNPAAASRPVADGTDSTVLVLRRQVDSLAASVTLLRDSVRLAALGTPARSASPPARSSSRGRPAAGVLPAPALPSSLSPSSPAQAGAP